MTRAAKDQAAALAANEAVRKKKFAQSLAEANGGKTGAPPGMLQDDSRPLSRALANAPHARQHVKEACAAIRKATGDTP